MTNQFVWFILVLSAGLLYPTSVEAADRCVDVMDSTGQSLQDNALLSPGSTIYIDGQAVVLPSNPQSVAANCALPDQLPAEPVKTLSFGEKVKKLVVGSWEIVTRKGKKVPEILNVDSCQQLMPAGYSFVKQHGEDGQAKILVAKNVSGELVALKYVDLNELTYEAKTLRLNNRLLAK